MKRLVIIGAGYAGILTAKKLAKKIKKQKKQGDVEITIIDRNPFHTMLTELHEVAAGRVDEDSIKISLSKVFAGRKVNVVLDTVADVDFEAKVVKGEDASYEYDYLVMAAGSQPTTYGVPGVDEYTFKLWSYEDAVLLKDHILNTFRRAAAERNEKERRRMLTFYVVGAGFTGVEMVGELAEYVPILCDKFEIDRKEVTMVNVDGLSRPVPNMPEKQSAKIARRLNKMGVELCMNSFVTRITEGSIVYKHNDKEEERSVGTVIWVAGIQSCTIAETAADALEKQRGGRIPVDKYLRSTKDESVYVVGDNMYYVPEGDTVSVPQMVENGEQSADTAAHNLTAAVTGQGEMEEYKPSFHGVMVCVGGRYGTAHVGFGKHFFGLPSWLAMFAKHFINIIYFIQVLGWNKVFSYMKHEFFTVRNCRSFVGGHFSNRTPSFLLAPLRFWLGAVWLFEGIMKVVEGWFSKPMLNGFFGGANSWYDSILSTVSNTAAAAADAVSSATAAASNVTAAADAVSSATGAAGAADAAASVGHVIFNWNILGLFKMIFVSGADLASSTLSDLAFKLDVPVMNWFVNKCILPNDGVQMAMQIFIVVMEILIGLALMGGLLTSPAAAMSLVLQFMFVCTTGLYLNTFWMIFAGIAVLIGAGRTFGLDYYAMPALKKWWRKLPLIRKSYLYHD
ncbi:NAD(P)/FAD-dependent oxidoreductase [Clostridium sp. C105KSO13]|uniref:NAD(P)/FAD-dependent oxidoreductase n=1 Tax=Clostridium sp. C105KSO13 TaxID=1776045 RepID=UPI0007406DB5|nr:NAD(P)/FAD-dependent oxidoreductase [Clostridium sp. C105KSO13]CUX41070.1 NADH dehydrogenase-like protein [Clostridium sp. C105KSO13]